MSRDLKLVTQLSPKMRQYRTLFEKIAKKQDMDLVRVLRKGVRSSPLDNCVLAIFEENKIWFFVFFLFS